MELRSILRGRTRLASAVLAALLALVSIRSMQKGRRFRGVLAGAGALALGMSARAGSDETGDSTSPERAEPAAPETASDVSESSAGLTCAICGDPIRPGQRRGPNENDVIVHDKCA